MHSDIYLFFHRKMSDITQDDVVVDSNQISNTIQYLWNILISKEITIFNGSWAMPTKICLWVYAILHIQVATKILADNQFLFIFWAIRLIWKYQALVSQKRATYVFLNDTLRLELILRLVKVIKDKNNPTI